MRERIPIALVGLLVAAALTVGCASEAPASVLDRSERFDAAVDLPRPDLVGEMTLEEALAERRSRRVFDDVALPLTVLGQLFWAGQGITDSDGHRTAPSAGGRYPLELYAVTTTSVLHYLPEGHRVEQRTDRTALASLGDTAFGQEFVTSAPAVIVVTGVDARTEAEYGALAADFVEREAGHATQNVLLQATALGLAATPVGGFDPAAVAEVLALPPGEEVLYLVPVGERPT
jgi:SagB-type dehydrogenase family enzyme